MPANIVSPSKAVAATSGGNTPRYSRQNSRTSSTSSSSIRSCSSSGMGSSSFMVGRERDRSAEMEMFSHGRKPRSNYRRPSNLGLSTTPLNDSTEVRGQYQPKPSGRGHIVPAIPDHLKMEGNFSQSTELNSNYRNLSPARPVLHKIKDHLRPEGDLDSKTESAVQYRNLKPKRPIINKIRDHSVDVQPEGIVSDRSEYRGSFQKGAKGERVKPDWVSNFSKVTIDGSDSTRQ